MGMNTKLFTYSIKRQSSEQQRLNNNKTNDNSIKSKFKKCRKNKDEVYKTTNNFRFCTNDDNKNEFNINYTIPFSSNRLPISRTIKKRSQLDRTIFNEKKRLVVIRFGDPEHPNCIRMDNTLLKIQQTIEPFAVVYFVNIAELSDYNNLYELFDPVSLMLFYKNQHLMTDLGTGNNNKINKVVQKDKLIEVLETAFNGALKGKKLIKTHVDLSSNYSY